VLTLALNHSCADTYWQARQLSQLAQCNNFSIRSTSSTSHSLGGRLRIVGGCSGNWMLRAILAVSPHGSRFSRRQLWQNSLQ
jgi:hypothetical protein